MFTEQEVAKIIRELCAEVSALFPGEKLEAILFGSYARRDAEPGSDIDVMILADSSRNEIADKNWDIGNIAADILMNYGVVVSPVVENREFFRKNTDALPFYRNIANEGVRLSA